MRVSQSAPAAGDHGREPRPSVAVPVLHREDGERRVRTATPAPPWQGARMATIHTGTTLVPSKLELLADWLPRQPWYRITEQPPALSRAGGFRLDDPAGEVGIEFLLVTDGTAESGTTYVVPLSYRGAPLDGVDAGLVGTTEHGVLGRRWVYDGAHDPVVVAQLLQFMAGRTEAQHQSRSDTPDPSVGRSWAGGSPPTVPDSLAVSDTDTARTSVSLVADGPVLELVRVLQGDQADDGSVVGHVEVDRTGPDGATTRGTVVVVR